MNLSEAIGIDTSKLLEITFTLVLVFLIVRNASAFSRAIGSLGGAYVNLIKAFQGR